MMTDQVSCSKTQFGSVRRASRQSSSSAADLCWTLTCQPQFRWVTAKSALAIRREEVTPSASLLSKSFSAGTKSRHGNSAESKVSRFGNPLTAKRMEVGASWRKKN